MALMGFIGGLALFWLVLDLAGIKWRGGLPAYESQHSPEMAAIWLRAATGYRLIFADEARGYFVWERGRRFHDGGLFYYCELWRDRRTGRGRFVVGVVGHRFHTREELACARAQFVAGQQFHLTPESAEDAVIRAANLGSARAVHPTMRRFKGRQTHRPPAIDVHMSPSAVRFSLRVPLSVVVEAIGALSPAGWRLVETASLSRGLIAQHRYCFRDAAQGKDGGTEYLLEVCGYASGWAKLAIDWFPRAELPRPPRRPTDLEADIRRKIGALRAVADLVD